MHRVVRIAITVAALSVLAPGMLAFGPTPSTPLADFDFDDGLQGWVVEHGNPAGSSWARLADRDDWDNGPNHRHAGNPGFDALDVPDGDHHLAIEWYRNDTDTAAVSPVLTGDGTPVELSMDLRYWVEGHEYDFGTVSYREVGDDAWSDIAWIGRRAATDPRGHVGEGRGRYPLWEPVAYTFTPGRDFQVRFHFVADAAGGGEDVRGRDHRDWVANSVGRVGFGVWIDDVVLRTVPTMPGHRQDGGDVDGHDQRSLTSASSAMHRTTLMDAPAASGTTDQRAAARGPLSPGPDTGLRTGPRDRAIDQATHPEYQALLSTPGITLDQRLSDPFHWEWAETKGRQRHVWIMNRYDTPLAATLFAPSAAGRHPAIVFVGGMNGMGNSALYTSTLQRIADHGYVVVSVAPQYHAGASSWTPAKDPAPQFCGDQEETADAWWRQPQEAGLTEPAYCAGHLGDAMVDFVRRVATPRYDGDAIAAEMAQGYRNGFGHTFTFAGIDAAHWLTSTSNPWRHLVDRRAIGVAGHSAGGFAAVVGASADPHIRAAVAVDQYGTTFDGLEMSAPTLLINYEGAIQHTGSDMTNSVHQNPLRLAEAARDEGLDAGFLVVRDTEHNDITYVPSDVGPLQENSRWGPSVTLHYLLAWFDLQLRGDEAAAARLTADRFDGTVDRSAYGQGRWDPVLGNVPYRIDGDAVADHLSPRTDDWIHLDGVTHDIG